MTTVLVFNGSDGTGVNIAGTIDGTRFHMVPDGGLGVQVVYAADIYTVFDTRVGVWTSADSSAASGSTENTSSRLPSESATPSRPRVSMRI